MGLTFWDMKQIADWPVILMGLTFWGMKQIADWPVILMGLTFWLYVMGSMSFPRLRRYHCSVDFAKGAYACLRSAKLVSLIPQALAAGLRTSAMTPGARLIKRREC
jgi:hypothetical protein